MLIKLYLTAWLAVGGLKTIYPLVALERVNGSSEALSEDIGKLRKKRKKLKYLFLLN